MLYKLKYYHCYDKEKLSTVSGAATWGFSDTEKLNVGGLLAGNFRQSWVNKGSEKEEENMV